MPFLENSALDYRAPRCFPIRRLHHILLWMISFLLVAFGQSSWCPLCGVLAAAFGYTLFWRSLWAVFSVWHRFWLGTAWFTLVQLIQLSWLISHPYTYIYAVWMFLSAIIGLQFGLLCFFIRPEHVQRIWKCAALAGLWAILEWLRLSVMSGFTWNPVGLALSSSQWALQSAAVWGVYGLSFWVIFVNLLALRCWLLKKGGGPICAWIAAALLPYLFGFGHIAYHEHTSKNANSQTPLLSTVLVQTAFPIEEMLPFQTIHESLNYVQGEWKQILKILQKQHGKKIDLIVFPECTVPYGTYSLLYPHSAVVHVFRQIFGTEVVAKLPQPIEPIAEEVQLASGSVIMVSNAYWSQAIANVFNAGVLIGLEDHEVWEDASKHNFISAHYFTPQADTVRRYDKRVLLPMAEYIPSDFLKTLASRYGVLGSCTPGECAHVFHCGAIPFGISICYEETFGDLMRENKHKGAQFLANLTSDIWYPHSTLPHSHFEHARLRTVELGMPLIRSCNTGVTAAVDSFGRTIALLGETSYEQQNLADSLHVEVPILHYPTLYSYVGDRLIIGLALLLNVFFFLGRPWRG